MLVGAIREIALSMLCMFGSMDERLESPTTETSAQPKT